MVVTRNHTDLFSDNSGRYKSETGIWTAVKMWAELLTFLKLQRRFCLIDFSASRGYLASSVHASYCLQISLTLMLHLFLHT